MGRRVGWGGQWGCVGLERRKYLRGELRGVFITVYVWRSGSRKVEHRECIEAHVSWLFIFVPIPHLSLHRQNVPCMSTCKE